ncbi:oxygenase MpaB family protein [Nocardioides sp. R-C-SC26]|uniref:oxygenase MpaB family protein n=1 Tax=Nocardioides sp. R-C-SC26 TaxID=2870414 RepID=UPI001E60866D|nr:oxygenase MpaB family protein [Nocardioides sp. R-C-SC26]
MTHDGAPSSAATPDPAEGKFGLDAYVCERMLLLGAGSSVMYQLAMKGVGLGVAEHSTTLRRPVDRLRTTLTFVYVMVLGTEQEKKEISRLVNRMHTSVRSPGRYSAFDPELQLWVAATLVKNGEWLMERMFGPMDAATRERCYREAWIYGTALQVTPQMWPQTRAEFDVYWEESLAKLEADPIVQCYAKQLLSYHGGPVYLRLAVPLQNLLTRGNLDARTREVLALPWSRRDQMLYDLFWKVFPPVYRRVPRVLRQLEARLILRDMRKRFRQGRRVI